MRRFDTSGTTNDYLSETEARQLEEGLRILARIIARVVLKERSLRARSRHEECSAPASDHSQVTAERRPDESLTLSVAETAKMLGLSRNSVYVAVHTGQIPSITFGKRIFVPRVALNRMISQADNSQSRDRQQG